MALKPADLVAGLRGIGDRVFQMFSSQPPAQNRSSLRIEELPPDVESGLPA